MKANSKTVFNYVKEHEAENITAPDIAEGTGLGIKSVNGIITSAFCRKGKDYMVRVPGEVEFEDEEGNVVHKPVKFIKLTDKGRESTVESIEAEELAVAQAKLKAKLAE